LRIQISKRHGEVPEDVLERARAQAEGLTKYDPRATAAELVFDEEKVTRKVEIIVHTDGGEPVVGHGEADEFRAAVDQGIDRVGRMLREQRKRQRAHQAPPLSDRLGGD